MTTPAQKQLSSAAGAVKIELAAARIARRSIAFFSPTLLASSASTPPASPSSPAAYSMLIVKRFPPVHKDHTLDSRAHQTKLAANVRYCLLRTPGKVPPTH